MTTFQQLRTVLASLLRNWPLLAIPLVVVVVLVLTDSSAVGWPRLIALGLVAVGVLSNVVVICANGGKMPAQTDEIPTENERDYTTMDEGTRLAFLGDWIQVKQWLLSPGDVCLYAGLVAAMGWRIIEPFLPE